MDAAPAAPAAPAVGEFRPGDMRPSPLALVIGPRATGKSFLLRDLVWHLRDAPWGAVMCTSTAFYRGFMPRALVHDEYSPRVIERFLKRGKRLREDVRDGDLPAGTDTRAFVVLDDVIFRGCDATARRLFANGPCHDVAALVALPSAIGIPRELSAQADYVFVLRCSEPRQRRALYDTFGPGAPTFDAFCAVLDAATADHQALVIERHTGRLSVYRARDRAPFRACASFWDERDSSGDSDSDSDGRTEPQPIEIAAA
jgi:hypothetical protein